MTNIRHKVDKTRIVRNVVFSRSQRAYILQGADYTEVYPDKLWEEADVDNWEEASVTTDSDHRALLDGSTHVGMILNKLYRFQVGQSGITVEKFI